MTVSSSTNSVILSANGTDHSFAFTFKIFAASDLKVIVRSAAGVETVKTLNSEYIIADSSVGNANGGNVLFKFNTGTSSDAHYSTTDFRPANGEKVILRREQPQTQGLDLVANDPFPAESFEESLDKLTFMVQDVQEAVDRSFKLSRSNTLDSSGSGITSSYPEIEEDTTARANKLLSFDSTGTPIATQEVGTAKGDWAASTVYQERDIVRDTSTNNLFIVNTAHTSSGSEPLTSNANSSKYTIILNNGAYTNITASGVITGSTIEPTGDTSSGDNAAIGHTSDEGLILTGQGAVSDITFKNDADVTVFTIPTGTDDILFPDNAKILIGSGSDLRIYHESDNSYIDERGSGRLYILSDTQVEIGNAGNATNARFNSGGSSILHFNNSNKFETSDTGATLTGALTVSSHVVTSEIQLTSGPQPDVRFESTSGGDRFDLGIDATSVFRLRNYNDSRDDLKFDGSGLATFGGAVNITGALTVTGGIADSNLNTITTADKVSGAAIQIDGATDGTSITVVDTDKLLIDDNGTTKYINASQLNSYISAEALAIAADNLSAGDAAVTLTTTSGNITIDAQANNSDIIFKGTDGSVDTTFLTISGADAGQATFNGKIVADAGIDVDDFNIDGTAITLSAGNFSLNADSNILLNTHYDGSTSGGIIALKENNTNFGQLRNNSGELQIKSGASDTTALTFSGADATFSGTINTTSTNKLQFGDSGTYIHQSADGVLDLVSDTEIEINATTIDVNGNLDVSGSATIGSDVTSASGNFVTTGSNIALKHSSGENFFTASKDQGSFIYHDAYGILGTVATNAVAIGTTNGNTFTLDTQSTFLEIGNSGIAGGTDTGTVVLSATSNANDERIGDIRFANVANADDDGTDADGKMVARIQTKSVTSDSNASDDSGGTIVFSTKPEAGSIATALTLGSDQSATFGGNVDVTGTVTADGLTVAQSSGANILLESTTSGATEGDIFGEIEFKTNDSNSSGIKGKIDSRSEGSVGNGALRLFTGDTTGLYQRINIASNGDISFYEDTGTTPKFVWDSSSEVLRIGSIGTGIARPLMIKSDTNHHAIHIEENSGTEGYTIGVNADGDLGFYNSATSTPSVVINDSNNFGIGDASPSNRLSVVAADGDADNAYVATFQNQEATDDRNFGVLIKAGSTSTDSALVVTDHDASNNLFFVKGNGNAFIGGNVGIGITSPSSYNSGSDNLVVGGTSGDNGITIATGTTNGGLLAFADGTSGNAAYRGYIQYDHNTDFLAVGSAGSERMRIDSSGNVGIGVTSPSAGLHIDNPNDSQITAILDTDNSAVKIVFRNNTETGNNVQIGADGSNLVALTNATEAMRIDSSGNLLVGRTSSSGTADGIRLLNDGFGGFHRDMADTSSEVMQVDRGTNDGKIINFLKDGTSVGSIRCDSGEISVSSSGGAHYTFEGSAFFGSDEDRDLGKTNKRWKDLYLTGNVHITDNTNGPDAALHIEKTTPQIRLQLNGNSGYNTIQSTGVNELAFGRTGTEHARFDSSGNLLVGKTTSDSGTAGLTVFSSGYLAATLASNASAQFRRNTDDGDIVKFLKDSTTVGSIASQSGPVTAYLGSSFATVGAGDTGIFFSPDNNNIIPVTATTSATRDNAIDLGSSGGRFDDVFATNGTIQTSDENEKQDIAPMTTAELAVGKRLSTLFKTFRWKDKVTEKADKARTHSGIIAQEVKAAFEAEGLDATKYALFCSDTWTNDDGKEQTRMGVRYPELLSFIASYNESRFTAIEARLAKLEGA